MKSFTISVVLFVSMIAIIILNSNFMLSSTQGLIEEFKNLPEPSSADFDDAISRAERNWISFKKTADISCSYIEINKIDLAIKNMKVFAIEKNHSDYAYTKDSLIFLLQELSRLEKITVNGLF